MIIECPQCQSRYNASKKSSGESVHCRCGVDIFVPALPNQAKSWKCPNCSGTTDPNENKCGYCDAYLAFARCPSCFSIAPYHDANYCSDCGSKLTLPIKLNKKDKPILPCPRCSSSLHSKVIDSHLVELCGDCGGVWLSHQLLDVILKNEPLNSFAVLNKKPSTKKKPKYHAVSYLPCPECDTLMSRHNFMSKSYIILDQCHQHGIWFDKHELAIALDYMRSSINSSKSEQADVALLEKKPWGNRNDDEVFEIKTEDLATLLEEFPHWVRAK